MAKREHLVSVAFLARFVEQMPAIINPLLIITN
jgi:hypothetical protein